MEEKMITITINEYKDLLSEHVRVCVFRDYVNSTKYSIDREDCGRFLGFEIEDKED